MISKLFFILIINLSITNFSNSHIFRSPSISEDPYYNKYQVVFVSVIFRHGDRAPKILSSGAANTDENFNPSGPGNLTPMGRKRSKELGLFLRKRYENLLNKNYIANEVIARSSNVMRTRKSLEMVLKGLYPNQRRKIPFSYHELGSDLLLSPTRDSVKYDDLAKEVNESEEVEKEKNRKETLRRILMEEVPEFPGSPDTSFSKLYYTLTAEIEMCMEVPQWALDDAIIAQLEYGIIKSYEHQNLNTTLRRVNGGFFIKNITESMTGIAEGKIRDGRKIQLFAGYDRNIAAVLYALGAFFPHVPNYSSSVMVELLKDKKEEYHVAVRYNTEIPFVVQNLVIPGCSDPCPLGKFVELMKDVTPIGDDLVAYSDLLGYK